MEQQPAAPLSVSSLTVAGALALMDVVTVMEEEKKAEPVRRYIGASGINAECMAYHALCLRGFPSDTPSPQLLRIFDQGHRIEAIVVHDLKQSGHKVEEVDPATGEQWSYSSHGGHHKAHLDGYITLAASSDRMLLEIKSMNRKGFESFVKKGVQLAYPQYYDQVTDGMGLARAAGVDVSRAFIIAYCKDNSKYHAEIVEYDNVRYRQLEAKVDKIVGVPSAVRQAAYAKDFKCSMCSKRTSCWSPNVPVVECHHCAHARPMFGGDGKHWHCGIHDKEATAVCPKFELYKVSKA